MSRRGRYRRRLQIWASFVKLEHTLFSLPVMFAGVVLAARGWPGSGLVAWILLAGIGARTLAMALNRIIDRGIDAENPRTTDRELPAGKMTMLEATGIAGTGVLIYLSAVWQLPPICRVLSPFPVAVFALYPYMKRFTFSAHFGVGAALALAPLGGWVAVRGNLEGIVPGLLLALFTCLWVAGFDIIYATLDEQFDRDRGLSSLPARLGSRRALQVSAACHAAAVAVLVVLYARSLAGPVAATLLALVAAALVAEQRLARHVDLAFFRINIGVGFLVLGVIVAGIDGL